ncbi:MAG: 50S ribosomal protein L7ae-like protein [Ruminococcaceae bacterium]|nr:50S ribosomal protein L7ae-like protein [Oscillospiraceae bacterium]
MQRQHPNRRERRVSEALTAKEKVVGLKQTRRAVSAGQAIKVYLACDAEERLTNPLLESCRNAGIPVETEWTMRRLGKACGIEVGTAAAAVLAK